MTTVNAAVIYYSATGTVHALAEAVAEGAEKAGADVRLRKIAETAAPEAIGARPGWAQHLEATADVVEAGRDDLAWADVVLLGTPTRFGNPASQLRAFMESTAGLWLEGKLAGKVYSAFTASNTAHGGQESTILALANTFYHWGRHHRAARLHRPRAVQVGQPLRHLPRGGRRPPGDVAVQAARHQARRAVDTAAALVPAVRVGHGAGNDLTTGRDGRDGRRADGLAAVPVVDDTVHADGRFERG